MNKAFKKAICFITASFIALSIVSCSEAAAQTSKTGKHERWEYNILSCRNYERIADMTSEMNRLGGEGWELIEMVMSSGGELVFKRKLQ
ncbi:MAG: hypothetical protein LBH25_01165 [Fibromonadaceae bacterium]|nr:hypothetical protein [Fibromonadaceae bacterium]